MEHKCKYCGGNAGNGYVCAGCHNKLKSVQKLMKACEPFRELKRQRDERQKKMRFCG